MPPKQPTPRYQALNWSLAAQELEELIDAIYDSLYPAKPLPVADYIAAIKQGRD